MAGMYGIVMPDNFDSGAALDQFMQPLAAKDQLSAQEYKQAHHLMMQIYMAAHQKGINDWRYLCELNNFVTQRMSADHLQKPVLVHT